MPPVLGPSSPSKIRLKSCAGSIGTTVVPSLRANNETSGPSRYSSTTTSPHVAACSRAAARSVGDDDALAGRQAVVLDDVRRPERVEGRGDLVGRAAQPGRGGRHAGGRHHVLGEGLRAFQLGGRARRPEAEDARCGHGVGDAGHQRRLGADDDEVGADLDGQRGDRLAGHRVDLVQGRHGRDAGVARGRVHLVHIRVARQREGQGVLAPAGTDHERLHDAGSLGVRAAFDGDAVGGRPVPQHRVVAELDPVDDTGRRRRDCPISSSDSSDNRVVDGIELSDSPRAEVPAVRLQRLHRTPLAPLDSRVV